MPKAGRMLDPKAPLTPKQKKFMRYMVQTGGRVHESARRAQLTPTYGSFLAHQPKIQTGIQKALDEAGMTEKEIAKLLYDGAHATHPEKKSAKGEVMVKEHPDWYNRKDYVKMALQVRRDLQPDNFHEGDKVINITLNQGVSQGLLDSGVIDAEEYRELEELQHEPIRAEE